MENKDQRALALGIAIKAHAEQKDKCGVDYIWHPVTVALMCRDERAKIAALLHDVVEDTQVTLDDLRAEGIDEDIVEAVDCLTKREDEEIHSYLDRIAPNKIATEVKFADMRHNSDASRLDPNSFSQEEIEQIVKKYVDRIALLAYKVGNT